MAVGKKALQKIFYFSSERVRNLIERYTADESEITCRSASYLMEEHMLNDILPDNKQAADIVRHLYDGGSVKDAMHTVFEIYASGTDWKAGYPNGRAAVDYAWQHKIAPCGSTREDISTDDLHYFYSQLSYFKDGLNQVAEREKHTEEVTMQHLQEHREVYESLETAEKLDNCRMKYAKIMKDVHEFEIIIENESDEGGVYNDSLNFVYMTIRSNWDDIKDWTYTYRLMLAITEVQVWQETPEMRLDFVKMIKEISSVWN